MYEILDSGLSRVAEVEKVSSDNHSIHWQSAGTLTLIAAATEGNLRELRSDRFVLIRDTFRQGDRLDGLYIICSVQHDEETNELIVNGKAAPYLLHQRAMQERVLTDTTAGAALAGIANENARGLPIQADFASAGDPAVVRYPMDSGAVDERCEGLLRYCGIGMDAVLDSGRIRLTYSAGRDISAQPTVPVLGRDSGRAHNTSLTVDISDYYNVAVGTLAFTDGREEAFSAGSIDAQGTARRELHIGEIAQKAGESDGDFRGRAAAQAEATLAARLLRTTINADISPADYGRPYLVGDLVRVQVGPVTIKKRITAATWLFDQNNDKISLTLGDQLNTVVAEIQEQEKVNASKASSASARAGGAARQAAENKNAIVGIKSDFKSLIAQVDDLVAGMDAYVLEKVFEDYKIASARLFAALGEEDDAIKAELHVQASSIEGVETATAELTTRVSGAETALEMQSKSIGDLQTAQASLGARVDGAEASLIQKAEKSTVTDLSGKVSTIETAQASLGARVDGAEASINLNAQNINGVSKSVAEIKATYINLKGNVSVSEGQLTVLGNLVATDSFQVGKNAFYIEGKKYTPTEITSTTGTVLVLGIA